MKNGYKYFLSNKYFYSIIALILMIILSSAVSPSFLKLSNIVTILRQASVLLVLSTGLTAVVLTGGIDLSVGSVAGLVGCICAKLMTTGTPVFQAMLIGLAFAVLVGLFNGILVGVIKLPAFVATYGTNWVMSGIATIIMRGQVIYGLPHDFTFIGVGYIGGIPFPIIVSIIGLVIFHFIFSKTVFGRNLYMVGSNMSAARYSGTKTLPTVLSAYVLCSLMGGVGGIIMCARLNAADVAMCDSYGLQIVAAVVIGGTSLQGGEGGIWGTAIGAIILTMIVNVINLVGLPAHLQGIAVGLVILVMVCIDIFNREKTMFSTGKKLSRRAQTT